MAKYTITLTTAAPTAYICDVVRRRESDNWSGTAYIYGTFGSGTVVIQGSPDAGVTKFTLDDDSGTAMSTTAAAAFNFDHNGNANINGESPKLYATISGSTAATVTVTVYDNRQGIRV